MVAMATIPHFELPFRVNTAGYARTVEQNSDEDVTQCVTVLMRTRQGERAEVPEYGLPEQAFTAEPTLAAAMIHAQIGQWEPRARWRIDSRVDELDELVRHVQVGVDV